MAARAATVLRRVPGNGGNGGVDGGDGDAAAAQGGAGGAAGEAGHGGSGYVDGTLYGINLDSADLCRPVRDRA